MVSEDGQQLPMFQDPEQQFLDVIKHAAEVQRVAALLLEDLHRRNGRSEPRDGKSTTPRVATVPHQRVPINDKHRTWRGFVLDMQRLEAICRREGLKPSKKAVCQYGSDSPKTITRTMVDYGLRPFDWPPSAWDPDRPPTNGHV